MRKLNTENIKEWAGTLRAGDRVLLSGVVYTARDAAHKRIVGLIENGEKLPFDIDGAVIYYAGATPAPDGLAIGSCGPTTSSRMDVFTPKFLSLGLMGMVGKGQRSEETVKAIKNSGAVYFCAIGGAGALAAKSITKCEVIAFPELGCESVKKLEFKDFFLIVGVDSEGNTIF